MKNRTLLPLAAVGLAALLAAPSAFAATYYWDSNGDAAGFGSTTGTWGESAFWTTVAGGGATHSGVTDTTTGDTVSLGDATLNYANAAVGVAVAGVSVNKIVFGLGQTTAITLGAGGGTIALGGTAPSITVNSTGHAISSPITLGANSTVSFGRNTAAQGSFSLNGQIDGNFNLAFTTPNVGSGGNLQTIVLGAANTYGGNTTITTANINNTVTVKAGVANALPPTTVLTLNGGNGAGSGRTVAYDLNGNNQTLAGLTNVPGLSLRNQRILNNVGTAATLTISNSSSYTFSGNINGTDLVLVKSGAGTQTLSGPNAYTGGTTISGGTLVMGSAAALGGGGHALTVNGGALDMGAYPLSVSSLVGAGGSITNTAGLTVNQTAGANQFSGAIAGSGTLNKSGAGTLTLSAGNPYTGATTVSAGMLQIDGQLSGTSGVTVSNTATLKGSGSISGLITVLAGGTLAPGSSPGLLTVSNSVTMNGGSIFSLELAGYTPGAGGYDQLLMAGAADTFALDNATLTVDAGAFVPTNGAVFTVVAGFGTLNKTTGFNGDALTVTDNNNTEYAIGYAMGDQPNDVTLTVIPEPANCGLVGFISVIALLRRRLRA